MILKSSDDSKREYRWKMGEDYGWHDLGDKFLRREGTRRGIEVLGIREASLWVLIKRHFKVDRRAHMEGLTWQDKLDFLLYSGSPVGEQPIAVCPASFLCSQVKSSPVIYINSNSENNQLVLS